MRPYRPPGTARQGVSRYVRVTARSGLVGEHLRRQGCLCVRDAELLGALVGHGQQPTDPAGDRVLGEHGVMQLAELLERGLLVLEPECAGELEVVGHLLAQDVERAFDPGPGRHGRPGGTTQVGVVEVGEPVGGRAHLAAHPSFLPGHQGLVGAQPREQRADGVAVADDHAVHAADLA